MRRFITVLFVPLIGICMAGCGGLFTGQFTISYHIDGIGQQGNVVDMYALDFNDDSDYNEHKDNIESIDEVSLVAWLYNYGSAGVNTRVYVDTVYTHETVEEVIENAALIFAPEVEVPANDSILIDWENGRKYMVENSSDFLEYLIRDAGAMAVYAVGSGMPPYYMRVDAEVVITFTAKN